MPIIHQHIDANTKQSEDANAPSNVTEYMIDQLKYIKLNLLSSDKTGAKDT